MRDEDHHSIAPMASIVLYVAATESAADSGATELERAGTRLSVVSAVSIETIRKRAPAADCVVFAETPTTAAGAHLLDVIDACGPTPLVLYTESEYGPTTARATDGIDGYVRRDGDRDAIHLADEIHWVCHEPERGTAQAPIPIAPSESEPEPEQIATDGALVKRQRAAQRERLDAIERLIDHDVRNQLNLAKGYLTIARETERLGQMTEVEAAHEQLTESLEMLLGLAEQREVIATVEPVGLQDIARRAWARLDDVDTDNASLEFEGEQLLEADKERLTETFEQLFRVPVGTAAGTDDGTTTVRVGACSDGFFVAFEGACPTATLETLLESDAVPPEQGQESVETVRRIVDAHGWSMQVDAHKEGETRIEFTGASADDTAIFPDSPSGLNRDSASVSGPGN